MKKRYENPNLELIRINRGDIVITSGCDGEDICYGNANISGDNNKNEGQTCGSNG